MDNAFMNADLKENMCIKPPTGCSPVGKGMVLKLNKALNGLKQSSRK